MSVRFVDRGVVSLLLLINVFISMKLSLYVFVLKLLTAMLWIGIVFMLTLGCSIFIGFISAVGLIFFFRPTSLQSFDFFRLYIKLLFGTFCSCVKIFTFFFFEKEITLLMIGLFGIFSSGLTSLWIVSQSSEKLTFFDGFFLYKEKGYKEEWTWFDNFDEFLIIRSFGMFITFSFGWIVFFFALRFIFLI